MNKFFRENWFKIIVLFSLLFVISSFAYRFGVNQSQKGEATSNTEKVNTQEPIKETYKTVMVNNPELSFSFEVPSKWVVETRNSGEKNLSPEEIRDFFLTGRETILNGEVYIEGKDMMKNEVLKMNNKQLIDLWEKNKEIFPNASVAIDYISYTDWNSVQIDFRINNKDIDEQKQACTSEKCTWKTGTVANYPANIASYSGEDPDYGGATLIYTGGKTYFINIGNNTLIINKQGIDDKAKEDYEKEFSNLIQTLKIYPNGKSDTVGVSGEADKIRPDDWTQELKKLTAGVNINYFKSIIGDEPVFVNNVGEPYDILDIFKRSKECKNNKEQKELIFVNDLSYVQAVIDKGGKVLEYAITTRSKDFNPGFNSWNVTDNISVTLGLSSFYFTRYESPYKIDYHCGAHDFGYAEEYYFGNSGNYQAYILANNQSGIPMSDIACEINKLQDSPTPISPDREELTNLRRKATVNTYAVTAPLVDIEDICFGIGPTYSQVRVLEKQGQESQVLPQEQKTKTQAKLDVMVLPTDDGISGKGIYTDKYPSSVNIDTVPIITDKLGAYGLADKVWLALKDWTGNGIIGADGTTKIDLYPVGGSTNSGPYISYYEIPACVGCMLDAAAPYFANAKEELISGGFGSADNITIPKGLSVTPISPTLITYILPDEDGHSVRGVAYYNPSNNYNNPYFEAKFVLPSSESNLSEFLIKNFINQENLK